MGIFKTPKTPTVEAAPVYAQQKTPDYAAGAASAGRRATDKIRGAVPTILTSQDGVLTSTASSAAKTLLGA